MQPCGGDNRTVRASHLPRVHWHELRWITEAKRCWQQKVKVTADLDEKWCTWLPRKWPPPASKTFIHLYLSACTCSGSHGPGALPRVHVERDRKYSGSFGISSPSLTCVTFSYWVKIKSNNDTAQTSSETVLKAEMLSWTSQESSDYIIGRRSQLNIANYKMATGVGGGQTHNHVIAWQAMQNTDTVTLSAAAFNQSLCRLMASSAAQILSNNHNIPN